MKQDLISFWRYAFNSGRNTSQQQFLHSFYCFVVPFLIFLHFNGAYQSNQDFGFSGGIMFGLGFTITNLYAGLVYGVMMIPIASLYISRLRTNGRRVIWFVIWALLLPVWGPVFMLWPCLIAPRKRRKVESLRPKTEYD